MASFDSAASVLARRAADSADSPFLLSRDSTLTYDDVRRQSRALAAALSRLGVGAGDRVALVLPACAEFAVAAFAGARLGARIVPLSPRCTASELRYMLLHSGASSAVTVETAFGTDYLQLFEAFLDELPDLAHVVTVGDEDLWYDDQIFQWEDLLSVGSGRDFDAPEVGPDDAFAILYSRGVTGKPKGVELTHGGLLHAARAVAGAIGLAEGDVVAGVASLSHVFGLGPGLLGTLTGGAGLVLAGEQGASETLELAERCGATVRYGVPSMFAREVREIEQRGRRPESVRVCVASGAPLREALARRIEDAFRAPVLAHYSLTEASSTLAVSTLQDPADKRFFTVGRPVAGTEVRITETDGSQLPPESVGEIRVRGPGVMLGYYRQPRATASAVDEDGYLGTGDLGMIDDDGYLHVLGRREDMVIRGGVNVQPREIEDRMAVHPAVDRCAAVGLADEILGEALCACVIRVEGGVVTERGVKEWCAAGLGDSKVPDTVIFMDELPLTDAGTVWRQELARRVSARLADSS